MDGDERLQPLVSKSVKEQLAKKGYSEVPSGGDLEIVTWVLSEPIPQLEAVLFAPYGGVQWGTDAITTMGRYNRHGTLAVNLIDMKTNKSVWAGMVTRALGKPSKLRRIYLRNFRNSHRCACAHPVTAPEHNIRAANRHGLGFCPEMLPEP